MKVYRTSQGNWQLNFSENGKQRTLYLGRKHTAASAERIARIISEIVGCRCRGDSLPLDLLSRVGLLPARLRSSIERLGLVDRCFSLSLGELFERFLVSKSHLKKGTIQGYCVCRRHLVQSFSIDRSITSITQIDAEKFIAEISKVLADCTIPRLFRRCKTVFKFAVDNGYLQSNPFSFKVSRDDVNTDRHCYIDRETIAKILDSCQDDRERLAIVLGRFGGVRVPSELVGLRYSDFTDLVIRIDKETKTGKREVPLFREIREIFERLPRGDPNEFIFFGCSRGWFRSMFLSAINRAGVPVWEKLWINCRSSCITDLSDLHYSEKTLDAIFGNSEAVRKKHYIQFEKEKAYRKVLDDNEAIYDLLHNSALPKDGLSLREILLLRKLLVTDSGVAK
ncbi:hypothetical protein FACS1894189_9010 [Planctomycetales bacterium]|nr:hypothetical protein FACS1894189_9010 [Planctomycetales bacterium]